MHPILEQMIYYFIVFILAWFIVGLIMKGFMLSYIRVRLSFGRLILVKVRALPQDYYKVGKVEDGFLIFKDNSKVDKMISIHRDQIYRCLGINQVDFDSETAGLGNYDFSVVEGYDAEKHSNLYTRALYKPSLEDPTKDFKIVKLLLVIIIIVNIFLGVMIFVMSKKLPAAATV